MVKIIDAKKRAVLSVSEEDARTYLKWMGRGISLLLKKPILLKIQKQMNTAG